MKVNFRGLAFAALVAIGGIGTGVAQAQVTENNFAARKAIVINNAAPQLELSGFSFANTYRSGSFRLITNLTWKNTGSKPITAFEVVTLYYDPFNRPMLIGGRWLVTGHDSANWSPLLPGEADSDGLIGYGSEPVMTGIVYVRAIRYEDGTVWSSNQVEVEQKIRAALPTLKEVGPLDPGPKKPPT